MDSSVGAAASCRVKHGSLLLKCDPVNETAAT